MMMMMTTMYLCLWGWCSQDTFDFLREEGKTSPKMMSIGLHCRLVGKPGRAAALARFLDYIKGFPDVWICRRVDIARHWHQNHFPTNVPSAQSKY